MSSFKKTKIQIQHSHFDRQNGLTHLDKSSIRSGLALRSGFLLCLLLTAHCFFTLNAQSLKQSMDRAAEYFVKSAINIDADQELHILEVVDLNSGRHNETGKRIETELYFALERQFPDFKLFLGKGGNPDRSIFLKGTFERKGKAVVVKLRIMKNSQVLAQIETSYEKKAHRRTLVAVLDLEAETLNAVQRRALSNIFRSALIGKKVFDIASSSDVDKADPDAIQKATGCTRDQCATIIGEQLGVDRTISSSISRLMEGMYIIDAKIIDIKDGSILVSKTLTHNGELKGMPSALEKLAILLTEELTGDPEPVQAGPRREKLPLQADIIPAEPLLPEPREEIKTSDSGIPWWAWIAGAVLAGALATVSDSNSDNGNSTNSDGEGGDVTYTW